MDKSAKKIMKMLQDPKARATIEKVMAAQSEEEILAIAEEDGIALTPEQAATIFAGKQSKKELSREELGIIKEFAEE